ncbi:UNVERIFIED_ORG: iron complex outermembrane receptor protein [Xanthomonas axonopodis]
MSRLTLLAAACGLFATGATSPVLAADPAPPAATPIQRLPTVQVDAARVRGVDDFDLPASFTVVAADDDNRRGAQVSELLDGIPGLVARDRQNYAQDTQLSIRGFGARSTFGVRGVRLLVDGIPASMPDGQGQLSHFNVLGAQRVEVLRGPFSALYGNSSGGVLQLWSADGQPDDPWRLRATYGSNATVNVGAQLLGQQGAVHYNVAANHFDTDGFRAHSRARRESVNAKLGFDLAEGRRLDLVLNYLDAPDAQDPLGLTRAQFNADPAQATSVATQFNTRKSVRQSQAGAIFTQQWDNQALRLMAYGGQRSVEQFLAIPVAVQRNPLHSGGVIDLDSNYDGADARWAWQGDALGRPLQLTVGANVDRQRQHRTGYENFLGDTLGVKGALRRNQRDEVENVDQFAQLWWQWSERWSALLGVRHSQVRFDSDDHYIVGRNPDDSGRRDYSATTPVAGIVFRAAEDLRFYASVGRGFETPTFNELGYRSDGGAGLALEPGRGHQPQLRSGQQVARAKRRGAGICALPRRHRRRAGGGQQYQRAQHLSQHRRHPAPGCRAQLATANRCRPAAAAGLYLRRCHRARWLPHLCQQRLRHAYRSGGQWFAPAGRAAPAAVCTLAMAAGAVAVRCRIGGLRRHRGQRLGDRARAGLRAGEPGSLASLDDDLRRTAHLRTHRQCAGPAVRGLGHRQRWQRPL